MGLTSPDLLPQDPSTTPPPHLDALFARTTTEWLGAADKSAISGTSVRTVKVTTPSWSALGPPAYESLCTPLRPLVFERELASHPDHNFVSSIVQGITLGVKIGYTGPQCTLICSNLPSAHLNPQVIEDTLRRECEAGRMAGPFAEPPLPNFRSSGIGLVPAKKGGGWRMIHHLSAPVGGSINDFIDAKAFSLSYPSIDDAAAILDTLGRGTLMVKMDLKSAFRQIPVHLSDWNLLGLMWQGQYFFEKVLPFGLRSAPFLFNQAGAAVEWIMRKHGVRFLVRYLDDFLSFDRASECAKAKTIMLDTCHALNVPVNPEKTSGPSTRMEFLGITIDSTNMELSISHEKKLELLSDLWSMLARRTATKHHVLQLIGKLSFACKVIPAGRIFLRHLIDRSTEVGPLHHHVTLGEDSKADLR